MSHAPPSSNMHGDLQLFYVFLSLFLGVHFVKRDANSQTTVLGLRGWTICCVNIKCAMHDCAYTIFLRSDAVATILFAACFCAATRGQCLVLWKTR